MSQIVCLHKTRRDLHPATAAASENWHATECAHIRDKRPDTRLECPDPGGLPRIVFPIRFGRNPRHWANLASNVPERATSCFAPSPAQKSQEANPFPAACSGR